MASDRDHEMTLSTFRVSHMDCAAEEQLVRFKLADLVGIERVAVDLGSRRVVVEHELDPAEIDAALQTLNLGTSHLDDHGKIPAANDPQQERRVLLFAFIINAGFFVGEMAIGLISRSMGLVADALDMGADASVYALSLTAVAATTARKKQLARSSGHLQFGLATIGLIEVTRRTFVDTELPNTESMIVMSILALIGNLITLVILRRILSGEVHLQASWIFTANDIKVNLLVIVAAITVTFTNSAVPDLIVGAFIFLIVANGARRILLISR